MSITKSITTCVVLPRLNYKKPSHRSETRIFSYSSLIFASINNQDQIILRGDNRRAKQNGTSRRRLVVRNVVGPGAPPPSEPPYNFINWVVGFAITVVLPFFTHKWTSLLKFKNEVETAVETVEGIVDAVEKVAEGLEKVAEDISDDLPEGGRLKKAVDFIEQVAERANKDAHLVGDFIDKVQEVEEKVEDYVESLVEEHTKEKENRADEKPKRKEDDEEDEEDKLAHELSTEENSTNDGSHQQY